MRVTATPCRRLWLVFFCDCADWWVWPLKRGFRHVSAASYYADQERWVYVDATRRGLVIEVAIREEFDGRLAQLMRDSTAILRVPSAQDRSMPPFAWFCTGSVKALLGIRSCALSPWSLYRHLLAVDAECVEYERPDETARDAESPIFAN